MFKSKAVGYVNPVICCSTNDILGIVNGVQITHLFTSLKLDLNQTVLFFLGRIIIGDAHYVVFCRLHPPISHSGSTSL